MVEKYRYDVFGKSYIENSGTWEEFKSSLIGNTRLYTRREYDSETGLYFYRARYYEPETGKFINRDPIGTADNVNLYTYVSNNPVNAVDPTGNFEIPGFIKDGLSAIHASPRIEGAIKTVGGGLQAAGGGLLAYGSAGLCSTGIGCVVGAAGIGYGSTQVVAGAALAGEGLGQLITGSSSNYAQSVDFVGNGIDAGVESGLNNMGVKSCDTKTVVKFATQIGVDILMFKAYKVVGLLGKSGSAGKFIKNGVIDPYKFSGKSIDEIVQMLKDEGYETIIKKSDKSKSGAKIIKITNSSKERIITQVQVSPGRGRHGPSPYVKISTSDQGIIKIVDGSESGYRSNAKENAKIIFTK